MAKLTWSINCKEVLFWKYNFHTSSTSSSPAAERLAKLRENSSDLKSFFQLKVGANSWYGTYAIAGTCFAISENDRSVRPAIPLFIPQVY